MAAVVATEEPEIAAKNVQATMDTREIPPEIQPTRDRQHGKAVGVCENSLCDHYKCKLRIKENRYNT